MPRAPSEKMIEAEKLFNDGMAMVEIAKKLGVSDGTVRSWKNRYGWGDKSKKNKRNVAKKGDKKSATLQKRKKGGQPGNKNAKGGSGNPHPHPPPDRTKHGGYVTVIIDALDDDEQELLDLIPTDEESLLIEEIQVFTIRERRLLQAINKYRNTDSPVAVAFTNRTETKRAFKDEVEEKRYNELVQKQIKKGERMPGNGYQVFTQTENKDSTMARLEQELSTVQKAKTKAIEALSKLHIDRQKLEGNTTGNDVVIAWTEKILRGRGSK